MRMQTYETTRIFSSAVFTFAYMKERHGIKQG